MCDDSLTFVPTVSHAFFIMKVNLPAHKSTHHHDRLNFLSFNTMHPLKMRASASIWKTIAILLSAPLLMRADLREWPNGTTSEYWGLDTVETYNFGYNPYHALMEGTYHFESYLNTLPPPGANFRREISIGPVPTSAVLKTIERRPGDPLASELLQKVVDTDLNPALESVKIQIDEPNGTTSAEDLNQGKVGSIYFVDTLTANLAALGSGGGYIDTRTNHFAGWITFYRSASNGVGSWDPYDHTFGAIWQNGKGQRQDPMRTVFLHELGHCLGLNHRADNATKEGYVMKAGGAARDQFYTPLDYKSLAASGWKLKSGYIESWMKRTIAYEPVIRPVPPGVYTEHGLPDRLIAIKGLLNFDEKLGVKPGTPETDLGDNETGIALVDKAPDKKNPASQNLQSFTVTVQPGEILDWELRSSTEVTVAIDLVSGNTTMSRTNANAGTGPLLKTVTIPEGIDTLRFIVTNPKKTATLVSLLVRPTGQTTPVASDVIKAVPFYNTKKEIRTASWAVKGFLHFQPALNAKAKTLPAKGTVRTVTAKGAGIWKNVPIKPATGAFASPLLLLPPVAGNKIEFLFTDGAGQTTTLEIPAESSGTMLIVPGINLEPSKPLVPPAGSTPGFLGPVQ